MLKPSRQHKLGLQSHPLIKHQNSPGGPRVIWNSTDDELKLQRDSPLGVSAGSHSRGPSWFCSVSSMFF